jgi:hypothetical protein
MTDEDEKKMAETLRLLVTIANSSDLAPKFIDMMLREHRTHQQTIFRTIIHPLMSNYAAKENWQYDLRNEDTVKFCKSIAGHLDVARFSYI